MQLFDWLFVGLLSVGILSLLLAVFLLILSVSSKKQGKTLINRKIKNRKKRKRLKRKGQQLLQKGKKQRLRSVLLVFLSAATVGSAFYARYYQSTNLTDTDVYNVAQGYQLIVKAEEQVEAIHEGDQSTKAENTLRDLAARLAGFGVKRSNPTLTEEGQRLLKRYYEATKEFGLNLNGQSIASLAEGAGYESYQSELSRLKEHQAALLEYFSVNEDALKGNSN